MLTLLQKMSLHWDFSFCLLSPRLGSLEAAEYCSIDCTAGNKETRKNKKFCFFFIASDNIHYAEVTLKYPEYRVPTYLNILS